MPLRFKPRTSRDIIWRNSSSLDFLWGIAAPLLAFLLRESSSFDPPALNSTLTYVVVASIFTVLAFGWFRLGQSVSRYFSVVDAMNVVKASLVVALATAVTLFMVTRLENIPRSTPILHFILLAGGCVFGRAMRQMRKPREQALSLKRKDTENILIVGVTDLAVLYIQMIERLHPGEHGLLALLDNRDSMQGRFVRGCPVAGKIGEVAQVLLEYEVHGTRIDRIVLASALEALPGRDQEAITQAGAQANIPVQALPVMLGLDPPLTASMEIMELDTAASESLLNRGFWLSKRLFDVTVALLSLIIATPIFIAIAIVVLLDAGMPFLFWQVRVGRSRRRIMIYKFRTLRAPYGKRGEEVPPERRLSAVGRFLRKVRLDELPQLFSIVVGDMSFIGPRPLLPELSQESVGLRLTVRPGITGWAQVNGATLLGDNEKVALDEWYVRRASWGLDFRIMVETVRLLVFGIHRNEEAIRQALQEKATIDGARNADGMADVSASSG